MPARMTASYRSASWGRLRRGWGSHARRSAQSFHRVWAPPSISPDAAGRRRRVLPPRSTRLEWHPKSPLCQERTPRSALNELAGSKSQMSSRRDCAAASSRP